MRQEQVGQESATFFDSANAQAAARDQGGGEDWAERQISTLPVVQPSAKKAHVVRKARGRRVRRDEPMEEDEDEDEDDDDSRPRPRVRDGMDDDADPPRAGWRQFQIAKHAKMLKGQAPPVEGTEKLRSVMKGGSGGGGDSWVVAQERAMQSYGQTHPVDVEQAFSEAEARREHGAGEEQEVVFGFSENGPLVLGGPKATQHYVGPSRLELPSAAAAVAGDAMFHRIKETTESDDLEGQLQRAGVSDVSVEKEPEIPQPPSTESVPFDQLSAGGNFNPGAV
jgi:hypothetical protein